jgi:hypothetical protein
MDSIQFLQVLVIAVVVSLFTWLLTSISYEQEIRDNSINAVPIEACGNYYNVTFRGEKK